MNQYNSGISLIDLFEVSFPGFATGDEELTLIICNKMDSFEYQYAIMTGNNAQLNWLYPDPDLESIYIFPLYLNESNHTAEKDGLNTTRQINLNQEITGKVAKKLSLRFVPEKEEDSQENASPVCYANSAELSDDFKIELPPQSFAPLDLLDYVYAFLHSPAFNKKYKTSLIKDFPWIPYPPTQFLFWKMVRLGGELRTLHLLKNKKLSRSQISFPIKGTNEITDIYFEENQEAANENIAPPGTPLSQIGKVYINKEQFFQSVPKFTWEMVFGNYPPVQKWLQKRKGTFLSEEDQIIFPKMITALTETDKIRKEIDASIF